MAKVQRRFIYVDKDFKTVSTRNSQTGKLTGRKKVSGRGDSTAVFRVKKGHPRSGEIIGRTHPIPVRASKNRRGTIRKRL